MRLYQCTYHADGFDTYVCVHAGRKDKTTAFLCECANVIRNEYHIHVNILYKYCTYTQHTIG